MFGLAGIKLYAAIGAAILLAGLLVTLKVQHGTIGKLRTEVGSLTAKLDTAISANESQSKSIDQLQAANNEWAALGASPADVAAKIAELALQKSKVQQLADQLRRSQRDETPDCLTWRHTDLDAACHNVVIGLRKLATGDRTGADSQR